MFKGLIRALVVVLAAVAFSPAFAQERGTSDEAVAMVKKAVELVKSAGKDKALAAFNDPNGGFQVKDLYVFAQDLASGATLAHKNPGLIGKDLRVLKDADGKAFGLEMTQLANEKGSGWVDYKWVNAQTKKIEPKSSYIERVGDIYVGVGIYK